MSASLAELSLSVAAADGMEDLARPLLAMLQVATGLESTCLTSIDPEAGVQQGQFTLNQGSMQILKG